MNASDPTGGRMARTSRRAGYSRFSAIGPGAIAAVLVLLMGPLAHAGPLTAPAGASQDAKVAVSRLSALAVTGSEHGVSCGWSTFIPEADTTGGGAPNGRLGHSAIVDGPRRRLVIFAGDGDESAGIYQTKNDVWSLSLDGAPAWTAIHPSGTTPPRRRAHTAIFDAPRDRMIVFGGVGFDAGRSAFWPDDSAAVWSLSLSATPDWSVIETPQALLSRRFAHAVALDPTRDRMWVYGGADQIGSLNFSPGLYYLDLAGTPAWTSVTAAGPAPPGLAEHVMAYDASRDRILLFGGIRAFTGAAMQDVWQLTLSGTPTWSQLTVEGTPPQETTNIRAVYDPVGDQLVVIGPDGVQALTLSGTPTWRPSRTHPTRYGPAVAYDSAGMRILSMGGELGTAFANDVLQSTPSATVTWSVTPKDAGAVTLEYHGDCPETVTLTAVPVHGYDFSSWSGDVSGSENPLSVALGANRNVLAHFTVSTAVLISRFDATRTAAGIQLRWGFGDPTRVVSTAIDRRRAGEAAWQRLAVTILRERGDEVALDTDADAALEYDYRLRVILGTGEELIVGPVRATASALARSTTIESVSPNPSPGRVTIAFTIAERGVATLTVLDVAGRHVSRLVSGDQTPGTYQAAWDGTAEGRSLPAGLYFARLSAAGNTSVRRLVLAR